MSDEQKDQGVISLRRALEILPGTARLLGVESGRLEWTGADSLEASPEAGIGPGDATLCCHVCGRPFALHGTACSTLTIRNDTDEAIEFRVVSVDGPRFGDRLRAYADIMPIWACQVAPDLRALADAIDQDAEALRQQLIEDLRRQVAEAVEESRYTDYFDRAEASGEKDVLDAEPFLERLGAIFGELAEGRDDELCCSICGRPNALHGIACPSLLLPPEHENASERRERESARFEHGGRVEGVDR